MPVAKRKLRSLHDIRTLSGRADDSSLPHRAYMRLACLEMEKARRMVERNSAVRRLKKIDGRLRDIEAEEAAIRGKLGSAADGSGQIAGTAPESSRGKRRQFKIKY